MPARGKKASQFCSRCSVCLTGETIEEHYFRVHPRTKTAKWFRERRELPVKCPKNDPGELRDTHGRSYANAENKCSLCGHRYEVTTFLGICNRSFKCPCCRIRKSTAKEAS